MSQRHEKITKTLRKAEQKYKTVEDEHSEEARADSALRSSSRGNQDHCLRSQILHYIKRLCLSFCVSHIFASLPNPLIGYQN